MLIICHLQKRVEKKKRSGVSITPTSPQQVRPNAIASLPETPTSFAQAVHGIIEDATPRRESELKVTVTCLAHYISF